MDMLILTDAVRFVHILAVAVGLGGSFMADYYVITRLKRPVSLDFLGTLKTYHKIVWAALVVMWLTGIAMIGVRTGFQLDNFTPKLFSKLFIVILLTANAHLISKIAMPMVTANLHRSLLALPLRRKFILSMVAGVSTTSWLLALACGVSKLLATSGWPVFILALPLCYGAGMIAATTAVLAIHYHAMNELWYARMERSGLMRVA